MKQLSVCGDGPVKHVPFCGKGLVKQVCIFDVDLADGLVRQE